MPTNPNVKFLRGNSSTLPSGSSIIDGALYVTLDSKRLFMGYDNGTSKELLPLAEGITTVTSIASLPAANQHTGEFYYIPSSSSGDNSPSSTTGNILAWSNGTSWLQTNIDTTLVAQSNTALSVADGSTNDTAEVSLSLTDTAGNDVTGSFVVAPGSANVHIGEGSSGELEITVDIPTTYELKSEGGETVGSVVNGNDNIALVLDPSVGNDQKIPFKNSSSVEVRRDQSTGAISFVVDPSGVSGVSSAQLNALSSTAQGNGGETSGYELDLETSDQTHYRDHIDPEIRYGASYNASSGYQSAKFIGDKLLLNVPTNSELTAAINNLEKTINALRYMGVVTAAAQIPNSNASSAYHNGDVYLANGTFTIGGKSVKPGYLIIVQGTEGTDGTIPSGSVSFDVVAGNDTDTTYSLVAISHGIQLQDEDNNPAGASFSVAAGTSITLTDNATGTDREVTIAHAGVTRTDPAKDTTTSVQAASTNLVFDVVTGVTTNAQGHVTAVATKQVTVVDTQLNPGSWSVTASASNNTATVAISNSGDLGSFDFDIASTGSLSVTASGDTVTIDLVWGTF